jgi:NAD(P)-dependent dehydrogenase (short-subunit alcohol dehydrogenase family)
MPYREVPGTAIAGFRPVIDHGEQSYRGRQRLAGLTALVTDADSGLGRAVAIAFAREGADVGFTYSEDGKAVADTMTWVQDAGRRAIAFASDPRELEQHRSLADRVARELGRIHIFVGNAPFEWLHHAGASADTDVIALERAFRTSLEATFQLALAMSESMAEGGSIILTAPMRYAHPVEPVRALAANGHGIGALTASLARTLAPKRIRVNALVPGPVCGPRTLEYLSPEAAATFGSETLQGRAAQPAELAPAFVFLAAPAEAAFVNAATLEVTGGAFAPTPQLK